MGIDVYSVMYNEEFILPYFLRHYETIADRIFVWEDNSTDNTRKILEAHPKVTILPMDKHGDNDIYWVTELFPQYEIYSPLADWVIIADADEFVYHPELLKYLKEEKEKGTRLLQCAGFSMVSDHLPTTSGQIYDEIQLGLPDKLESKWTIFSPDIWIRFHKGRHGRPRRKYCGNAHRNSDIKLLHYRYMGEKFYEDRNIRNVERMELSFQQGFKYSKDQKNTMPDGRRAVPLDWFSENKDKAVNVIERKEA